MTAITLDDLSRPFVPEMLPWLDRPTPMVRGFKAAGIIKSWHDDGLVILPGFMPDEVVDRYAEAWIGANTYRTMRELRNDDPEVPGAPGWQVRVMGWPDNCPYMRVPSLRNLCCNRDLAQVLEALIGEPMGVHLNLSGWRSTTRDWHQDGYLNPDHVADHYAAVWVALDDIHPDAGPFEYVPGSHRLFPPIRREAMVEALGTTLANPMWPNESERILTPIFEQLIEDQQLPVRQFIARKGDVLIWHARLLHRGSRPNDPTLERRAIISHYSGIHHRVDMPAAKEHGGGHFFPIVEPGFES